MPYVICFSLRCGRGYSTVVFTSVLLEVGSLYFTLLIQLRLAEEYFLISNCFSLHNVQLCSLPSGLFYVF